MHACMDMDEIAPVTKNANAKISKSPQATLGNTVRLSTAAEAAPSDRTPFQLANVASG
jgi:hypothetical protein